MNFSKPVEKFHHIQALRGIAATLVVLDHTLSSLIKYGAIPKEYQDFSWHFGSIGVSAFFVISGFIMVITTADRFGDASATWSFIEKRLIRIVPTYWIATFAICAFFAATAKSFSVAELIKSLLFIPYVSPEAASVRPLIGQGWTLDYEMFFYAVFALMIPWRINWALTGLSFAFLATYLSGFFIGESHPILHFYTNSIILMFLAGAWIGYLKLRWPVALQFRNPVLLITLALVSNLAAYWISATLVSIPQPLLDLTQVFCVAVCAFSLPGVSTRYEKVAEFLGDASYSTYLFHTFLLAILNRVLVVRSPLTMAAYIATALIGSNVIGLTVNRVLERRLTKALRREPLVAPVTVAGS